MTDTPSPVTQASEPSADSDSQRILDYVRTHTGTTFAQLERLFRDQDQSPPGQTIPIETEVSKEANVIFWTTRSRKLAAAIALLHDRGEIHFTSGPAVEESYAIDGISLDLPRAMTLTHHKTVHWLPAQVALGPRI